jgi:hypothetical protein
MVLGYRERQATRRTLPSEIATTIDARLERLERAVDTIAIEMERLGEGQRFTTRLLAERAAPLPDSTARRERSVTPH